MNCESQKGVGAVTKIKKKVVHVTRSRSAFGGLALFSTIPNLVQDILSKLLEDTEFVAEYIQKNNR